ncbi:peptidase M26 [Segatella buccae]|uniref:peptidase M26 n=1 Tax=Segatella buccae TaxID=28126 RepID=UPI003A521C26
MVYIALGTTTISGCISDVDITGGDGSWNDSQAAGMVQAVGYQASVHITDCLVKGSITDNADESYRAMAGFVFSNSGTYTLTRCLYVGKNNATNDKYSKTFGKDGYGATFTDCYYLNPCGEAQGTQVTAERLKSGEMAKLLQGDRTENVWGQTLGTDTIPQPTDDATKRVYEVKFTYNGEVKATRYATNGQSIHGGLPTAQDLLGTGYNPHHYYAIAFADGFNASTTVTADRQVTVSITEKDCYEIASKADWQAFCALVEDGQTAVDAKMTKDVDLETDITMAGTANKPYAGTFDGQGHTLKIDWNAGSVNDVAPFGRVNGATIKNLRTEGSIRSDGYYLGGLIDEAAGGNITVANCVSAVNITSSYTSDRCGAGGLISFIYTNTQVTITDCLVKGSINASGAGRKGMGGFVYSQNGTCTFNNCLYLGTNNAIAGSNTFTYNATINNCYYLNVCNVAQGDKVTEEELKSGEVTKKLQGDRTENVWGQTLGTDLEPQLTTEKAKHVYKVDFKYMDEVKATRYANSGKTIYGSMPTFTAKDLLGNDYNPKLTYALNFGDFTANTPVTADKTVDVTVTVSGTFPIASKEDWKAFCDIVNGGQNAVDAKLTRNIDLGSEINMVGDDNNKYSGTFDGQNHTLTLNWDAGYKSDIAPFRRVDGATIKNLRTEGEIKSSLNFLSGLVYEAFGTTTISGCISAVNITSSYNNGGCDVAGIIECVRDKAKVTITDCVVKGKFTATTEKGRKYMAGFVCNQYGTCTLTNCLYAGENNCSRGYTFCTNSFGGTTITNCYYLNACRVAQGTKVTAEQLKNGEVTKKLQNNRTDKCYWAQQLGEMPDFYNAADKSKINYVYYKVNNGWACDDFRLTDGQPLPIGLDFSAANVTYERNFNGTQKATLCLPYDLSAQGFKAYTLSGGNKNEVHFKETKDKLTAYTPYYITADGTPLLGGTNIEVKAYTGANLTTSANGYSIKGTVVSMDNATAAAANAYILQDDGMFHKVTTDNPGATVPAYHAYIICPPQASGAKQLSVVLDGETTGIGDVTNGTTGADGPVYDLQGRRVADRLDEAARNSLPAGVYIVGGRKVVVK